MLRALLVLPIFCTALIAQAKPTQQELESECSKKKATSCMKLGDEYFLANNFEKALEYEEKACDLKNYTGCFRAGIAAVKSGNNRYGSRLLNEACDHKQKDACKALDIVEDNATTAREDRRREERRQETREREESRQAAIEEQRRQESFNQGMQMMNQMVNPSTPKRTNCRSYRNGSDVMTECE